MVRKEGTMNFYYIDVQSKLESVKNFVYGTLNIASQPILCPQNILKVATK